MHIRAVLFDLDNTLFDHQSSVRAGLEGFLMHFGASPSRELERSWLEIEQLNYDRFLAKEISFQEQRRERLRQFLPTAGLALPRADAELDELFAAYLRNYELAWTVFSDAVPTLQGLRSLGLPVAVVTNGNHDQQTSKIRQIGLEPLLDEVYSSDLMGHAKPDPEAFLVPCRWMAVSPAETLYVGDNYVVDIAGATDAGLEAVHLDRNSTGLAGTIKSLVDVIPMIEAQVPA